MGSNQHHQDFFLCNLSYWDQSFHFLSMQLLILSSAVLFSFLPGQGLFLLLSSAVCPLDCYSDCCTLFAPLQLASNAAICSSCPSVHFCVFLIKCWCSLAVTQDRNELCIVLAWQDLSGELPANHFQQICPNGLNSGSYYMLISNEYSCLIFASFDISSTFSGFCFTAISASLAVVRVFKSFFYLIPPQVLTFFSSPTLTLIEVCKCVIRIKDKLAQLQHFKCDQHQSGSAVIQCEVCWLLDFHAIGFFGLLVCSLSSTEKRQSWGNEVESGFPDSVL